MSPGKGLRLVQLESICGRKNRFDSYFKDCFGKDRKRCGEKGENVGYQHFLLFPKCFQKASFTGLLKVRIEW